jgi:RHS repeat-associated protein
MSLAGVLYNSYRYDAFGILVEKTEVVTNSFYYAGYQYDSKTGLYYLRSRYYNPETARFLTEDSFSGYYTDPLSLNKYTYCHNNPISYHDPDGFAIHNVMLAVSDGGGGSGGRYVPNTSQDSASEHQQSQISAETQTEETSFWKKTGNWLKNTWKKTTEWVEENASYIVAGVQIAAGIALMATGLGAGLGASLVIGGTLGIVTNVLGSQIGGGLGSMLNGSGAISTGISLMSCGVVGIIAGSALVLVGGATALMGANEVVEGVTGTNYIKDETGISDEAYAGLYVGLNITSAVGQIAGNAYQKSYTAKQANIMNSKAGNYGIDMDNLNFSDTVTNHTGRPYQNSSY